jgi:hypothetical protein
MLVENGSEMFIHRCKNYTETPNIHDSCFLLNNRYMMLEEDMKKLQTIEDSKFTREIIQHNLLLYACLESVCTHQHKLKSKC